MRLFNIRIVTRVLSVLVLGCVVARSYAGEKTTSLQPVWTLSGIDTPESVMEVNYKKHNFFVVSAIEGDFFTKDGKGSLVKINSKGEIIDAGWVTGLNAPKGLAQYKDLIYVADIDEIVVVDVKSGKIAKRIPVPEAVFLNDVAADNFGAVYVSDTFTGKVYRLKDETVELYLENVGGANGLWAEPHRLLVGAATQLLAFDAQKNATQIGTNLPMDIDGITPWKCGSYLVSSWSGQISLMSKKQQQTLLLDSVAEGINTADIMYSERAKLLFVPNFFKHTVTAYKVSEER
jgi:hypothetical protein